MKDDTENNVYAIFYQNQFMKELYSKYADTLFIDSTYKLNKNKYPCLVLAVKDQFGEAQVVGIAVMAYERKPILRSILEFFSKNNSNYINNTKSLMIDKDLKEDDVLAEFFPTAQVLYCHFHVIKIFKR